MLSIWFLKSPSVSYSLQTHWVRGNKCNNYVVSSKITSLTYMQFYNLRSSWANYGTQNTHFPWLFRQKSNVLDMCLSSVSCTVCISTEEAGWLLHLAGQLGYICSGSPKKCMTCIQQETTTTPGWMGVQGAGQQQACMSMSTSPRSENELANAACWSFPLQTEGE